MNKYLLLPLLALAAPAAAQQTELIGHAGLGLMQFGGPNAMNTSHVNYTRYNGYEGATPTAPMAAAWARG
jgi:hypothetical protein